MNKGIILIKMNVEGIRNPKNNSMMEKDGHFKVPENQFWLKRLNDGDCELVTSIKKKQGKKKSKVNRKKTSTVLAEKPASEQTVENMGDK